MQIKCEEFKKHLKLISSLYNPQPVLKQTQVFTIVKDAQNMTFKYYTGTIFVETKIPNTDPVAEPITINVDGRLLLQLLGRLNSDAINVIINENELQLNTATNKYSFSNYTIDNVIVCPYTATTFNQNLTIDKDTISNIRKYNGNALGNDPLEKEQMHYLLNSNECISTNRNIISYYNKTFPTKELLSPVVINALSTISQEDVKIDIYNADADATKNFMRYTYGNSVIYTEYVKLNTFPVDALTDLKATVFPDKVKVNKSDFMASLERLFLFNNGERSLVFNFENNKVTIHDAKGVNYEDINYIGSTSTNAYKYFIDYANLYNECSSISDKEIEIQIGNDNFVCIKGKDVTKIIALSYED